jgi:hypothetical protein
VKAVDWCKSLLHRELFEDEESGASFLSMTRESFLFLGLVTDVSVDSCKSLFHREPFEDEESGASRSSE